MKENCKISKKVFSKLQKEIIPLFKKWNERFGIKERKQEENIFEYLVNTSLIDQIPCNFTLKNLNKLKNLEFDTTLAKKIVKSLLSK